MLLCTISLNTARCAGDAGLGVEGECIINSESKIAVVAGRDKSRLVGGCHGLIITRRASHLAPVIPSVISTKIEQNL